MSEKAISTRKPPDKDCTRIVQSVPRAQMEQKAGLRTPWEGWARQESLFLQEGQEGKCPALLPTAISFTPTPPSPHLLASLEGPDLLQLMQVHQGAPHAIVAKLSVPADILARSVLRHKVLGIFSFPNLFLFPATTALPI